VRTFWIAFAAIGAAMGGSVAEDARRARDVQDRSRLTTLASSAAAVAQKQPDSAQSQHESALVYSYLSQLLAELRDMAGSLRAAQAGMAPAEKAVRLQPDSAEYHRLLGSLYGQAIPGNVTSALRYGRKSLDELNKAIALAPENSEVYLSRGIGMYYLPSMFGGGPERALEDLSKALERNPKSDEALLWMGIALRKAGRNREAREALTKAVKLNPRRVWAKQQLDKTPAQ